MVYNTFYYTSQYFSLQALLFCWNKIFSFRSEADVSGVIKKLFLLLGEKKRFFITTERDYHVTCEVVVNLPHHRVQDKYQ